MRITDLILQNNFLVNINSTKNRLSKLQLQIATQSKISVPSDDPIASSRILKLTEQIETMNSFQKNIQNSLSFLGTTVSTMDSVQTELEKVMTDLTGLNNPLNSQSLEVYIGKIDLAINSLLDFANTQYGGKYLFGGTDNSAMPYTYNAAETAVVVNSDDIGGEQKVNISKNITQKINMTGEEVFSSVLKQTGTLNSTGAFPYSPPDQVIYDTSGNEYSFRTTYTYTGTDGAGNNQYDLEYDILDDTATSILSAPVTVSDITFDMVRKTVISIDGILPPTPLHISLPDDGLVFSYDITELNDTATGANNISNSINRKTDIFNTLISIKNEMLSGKTPTDFQINAVKDFYEELLVQSADAGNIYNKLSSTEEMIKAQQLELEKLRSAENDTDVAKAILDLQNQQYQLDLGFKVSSMILPQSLLDYL